MWPYWLVFALPLLLALSPRRLSNDATVVTLLAVGTVLVIFKGLRHQVGGDWGTYITHFERVSVQNFSDVLATNDPAYYTINWIVASLGGSIYSVNLICAVIVVTALLIFCRRQPLPWLALLIALPYFYTIVTFGYVRQGVAASLLLIAFLALERGSNYRFLFWVFASSLFHVSALAAAPFALLSMTRRQRIFSFLVGSGLSIAVASVFWSDIMSLWRLYGERGMESEGALIRGLMNGIAGSLFLLFAYRLSDTVTQLRAWWWISLAGIIGMVAVLILPATFTTLIDRLAVYLLPLQIFVFSRLHRAFPEREWKHAAYLGTIAAYTAVLFVWLNYAATAGRWVPYQLKLTL